MTQVNLLNRIKESIKSVIDRHNESANSHIDIRNRIPEQNSVASNIKMNGNVNAGSLSTYARADHIHPIDTSRAPINHTHNDIITQIDEINDTIGGYETVNITVNYEDEPSETLTFIIQGK